LQQHVGAVLVGNSTFYNRAWNNSAALAARHALPAMFSFRENALAGGLMSYGSSLGYAQHQAGICRTIVRSHPGNAAGSRKVKKPERSRISRLSTARMGFR
jgi:hypothetical protein